MSTPRAFGGPHRTGRRSGSGSRHTATRCRSWRDRRRRTSRPRSVGRGYAILIGGGNLRTGRHRRNEVTDADERHVGTDRPGRGLGDPHDPDDEGRMQEYGENEGERDRVIRKASEPGASVEWRVPPRSAQPPSARIRGQLRLAHVDMRSWRHRLLADWPDRQALHRPHDLHGGERSRHDLVGPISLPLA